MPEKNSQPPASTERRVLPMELHVGDRLTDEAADLKLHLQDPDRRWFSRHRQQQSPAMSRSRFFSGRDLAIGAAYRGVAIEPSLPIRHTRPGPTSVSEELPPAIELTVTTAALLRAIGLLAVQFPEKFHPEAWRALTAEYAQREIGYSARRLRLARHAYDALPGDVKAVLQGAKAN